MNESSKEKPKEMTECENTSSAKRLFIRKVTTWSEEFLKELKAEIGVRLHR